MQVLLYLLPDGACPVMDYLESLSPKEKARVIRILNNIKSTGRSMLRMPLSEFLEDDIFELRIPLKDKISRFLYFFVIGDKIIITNAFTKKTRKTPKDEIEIAKIRRLDYLKREDDNNE